MSSDTKPKIAIVTGASHRLGAAIATKVVELGYSLVLHYHSSELEAKKLSDSLTTTGANVYLFKADLAKTFEIIKMWEFVDEIGGKPELLINSASIMPRKRFGSISEEEFNRIIDLNLRAPFLCSQEASKRMPKGGQIVNISDIASTLNWIQFPLYSISRAAMDSMTRVLAKDLAPKIRVNGIAPGLVLPPQAQDPIKWNRLVEKVPMGRSGLIEEITSTLRFLIENRYITGQTIVIDGGRSIK